MGFIAAALASKSDYDVIVVGSGAAGGQTAYTLAMEGARVLMLEAGRQYSPEDRALILSGLQWLDDAARRRYSGPFATLRGDQQRLEVALAHRGWRQSHADSACQRSCAPTRIMST